MPKAKKSVSRKSSAKKTSKKVDGDCLIPPRVANAAINQFAFRRDDPEAQHIVEYVEWQCEKDKERVTFLEKVLTEHAGGPHIPSFGICGVVSTGDRTFAIFERRSRDMLLAAGVSPRSKWEDVRAAERRH